MPSRVEQGARFHVKQVLELLCTSAQPLYCTVQHLHRAPPLSATAQRHRSTSPLRSAGKHSGRPRSSSATRISVGASSTGRTWTQTLSYAVAEMGSTLRGKACSAVALHDLAPPRRQGWDTQLRGVDPQDGDAPHRGARPNRCESTDAAPDSRYRDRMHSARPRGSPAQQGPRPTFGTARGHRTTLACRSWGRLARDGSSGNDSVAKARPGTLPRLLQPCAPR